MSRTPTTALGLSKIDPGTNEPYDSSIEFGSNFDKLDAAARFEPVTAATRPAAPYSGKMIRETDTSRFYIHNGSTPASGGWLQVAVAQGGNLLSPTTTTDMLTMIVTGDVSSRWKLRGDGMFQWGGGASTPDTNLYRSAANVLKTDDSLEVVGNLTVTGTLNSSLSGSAGGAGMMRQDTTGTTTSATYTPTLTGGTVCGFAFVAPPSGKIIVGISSQISNGTAAGQSFISPAIRAGATVGSGTSFLAADDSRSLFVSFAMGVNRFSMSEYVIGLTPGTTYNVQCEHKTNGTGTGSYVRRQLWTDPV